MDNLEEVSGTEADHLNDEEVLIRKLDLFKHQQRMKSLSKMVNDMFHCTDAAVAGQVDRIMDVYKVCKLKDQYCEAINNKATSREVSKQE